jgi:transposase InsO family protein
VDQRPGHYGTPMPGAGGVHPINGKSRTDCLNAHSFMSLDDAAPKGEAFRREYNEVRPHSAIVNKPPTSLLSGQWHMACPDLGMLDRIWCSS